MSKESKRENILNAALEVFAHQGFNEATISEIAKRAEVGDATIYEYFKSKEDLLFSIPAEKVSHLYDDLLQHLQGIHGALNKLRKLIWYYLKFFESDPNLASILHLELRHNRRFLETPGYQVIRKFTQVIIDIIEEGKREGCIREEIDVKLARSLILGVIDHITNHWLLFNTDESLVELSESVTDLIINAVKKTQVERTKRYIFVDNKFYGQFLDEENTRGSK